MSHHRRALLVITVALLLDAAAGVWFAAAQHLPVRSGLAWALGTATTAGSRYSPVNGWGDLIQAAAQVTVIPLFAATFSLFTSGLTSAHVRRSEDRIREHIENRLRHHPGATRGESDET